MTVQTKFLIALFFCSTSDQFGGNIVPKEGLPPTQDGPSQCLSKPTSHPPFFMGVKNTKCVTTSPEHEGKECWNMEDGVWTWVSRQGERPKLECIEPNNNEVKKCKKQKGLLVWKSSKDEQPRLVCAPKKAVKERTSR